MGALYFGAAAVLGGIFVVDAIRTWRAQRTIAARQLFRFSLRLPRADVRVMVIDRVVSSRVEPAESPPRTLGLGVFAGALDLSVLSPALPASASDFGVQSSDLAWVFTIYLLVTVRIDRDRERAGGPVRPAEGLHRMHRALRGRKHPRDRRASYRVFLAARGNPSARRRRDLSGRDRGDRRRRTNRSDEARPSAWWPQHGASRPSSVRAFGGLVTHFVSWR